MIELYTWGTPNGRKVSRMLEECGLPSRVHKVDITQGEQFSPAYLAINPNGKIPALVAPDGPDGRSLKMMDSGAILVYLAGKSRRFLPASLRGKYEALQWFMFQRGGVGPMFGQAHHFFLRHAPQRFDYAIDRYRRETARLSGVLDARLGRHEYLAAREYAINTRSPTSPPFPGWRVTNGTRWRCRTIPASCAGSGPLLRGRPSSAAWRCRIEGLPPCRGGRRLFGAARRRAGGPSPRPPLRRRG